MIEIEDYYFATSQLAQTTLRSVIGQSELDQLLAERERINERVRTIIDEGTDPWGIEVTGVDGKPLQLTHRFRKKQLVQSFDGSQGGRRNVMSLRGHRLRIRVLVHSESLPADLSYQLTFAKR